MKYCGGIAKNSRCRKIVKGKREEEGSRLLVFTTTSQQARNPTLEPGSQSRKAFSKLGKQLLDFLLMKKSMITHQEVKTQNQNPLGTL